MNKCKKLIQINRQGFVMNNHINTTSINSNDIALKNMAWYKVPIMWFMIFMLGFTVISGVYLFFLAHDNNDSIVTESGYAPLNKKQAVPYKTNHN
ncbi:MAG: hypothetical protein ACI88H_004280 [Cocleimonas sp.]|jgi:hypothetical protein